MRKEIAENGNPEKIVDINEKILDFNNQLKGKGKGCPHMLASRYLDLSHVAKVSNHKVCNHSNLKILA